MRVLPRFGILSLAAVFGALTVPVTTNGAPAAEFGATKMSMASSSGLGYQAPPPQEGIKLLENIFQHMHSLPQLAIAKSKPTLIALQNNAAPSPMPAAVDQMLVIKPKVAKPKQAHKIALSNQQDSPLIAGKASSAKKREAYAKPTPADLDLEPNRKYVALNDRRGPVPSDLLYMRSTQAAQSVVNFSARNTGGGGGAPRSSPGGLEYSAPGDGWSNLRNSIGRLASASSQMASMQNEADKAARNANLGSFTHADSAAQFSNRTSRRGALLRDADGAMTPTTVSQSPMITEYNRAPAAAAAPAVVPPPPADKAILGNAPRIIADEESATAAPPSGSINLDQPGLYKYLREYQFDAKGKKDIVNKAQVALLPPTVVTGIPQVHLGVSESDAQRTLGTIGGINKQQIGGWTVWTVSHSVSHETILQLYIKHGMVEAMRVFDRSLMPYDLGVRLGDELASVKSKFGEPAFMVSEPAVNKRFAGQNYVYPISQVSFQLAKSKSSKAPQVVSLLIFNVR